MKIFIKRITNKCLILALILGIGANSGCSQSSQTSSKAISNQSKIIEIPSGVKESDYVENLDKSILFLSLNSDGQVFYQDKVLDNAALKDVLKQYNEKHLSDAKTIDNKSQAAADYAKSFYLKADVRVPFSQVLKVIKAIQASSTTSYALKFVVNPPKEVPEVPESAKELGETYRTPNSIYALNLDIGIPEKVDENAPIKPNPLTLVIRLAADGNVYINNNLKERSEFPAFLQNEFQKREKNLAFVEGTMEIEKTVFVFFEPDAKYGDVIKFVDELKVTGAEPIRLGDLFETKKQQGSGSGSGSGAPPPLKKKP